MAMKRPSFAVDFDSCPLLVIWEVTRACALACRHCRADAIDWRDPRELSLDEGKALLDDIRAMGTPLVIFSGGDPIQRDDLEDLIRYAKGLGLRVGTIPAATPRLTRERVRSLGEAGVDQMALSLDGPTEAVHDEFRRVPGAFAKTMEAAGWAREEGVPLQINTVFGKWNEHHFDAMADLVEELGAVFWEVFFLVPTGRGTELQGCDPDTFEVLFGRLHELSKRVEFTVKVTEAQHYKRYVDRHGGFKPAGRGHGHGKGIGASPRAVNAGKGFCFVDHTGDVYPSGFLPLARGNVREYNIADIYRHDEVFRGLRDPARLTGKCGRCEYRDRCGGSRSRAYGLTGDLYASDPFCVYEPAADAVR